MEDVARFVHMEEGQREFLERGKEDFKFVDGGKINVLSQN
jgi:hypothetical protein